MERQVTKRQKMYRMEQSHRDNTQTYRVCSNFLRIQNLFKSLFLCLDSCIYLSLSIPFQPESYDQEIVRYYLMLFVDIYGRVQFSMDHPLRYRFTKYAYTYIHRLNGPLK